MEKKKIMVVEDQTIVAQDIKSRLELMGYEVPTMTTSGEEAITILEEQLPDLILMDIKLKGDLDGIETSRIIMEKYPIPVVYLTAFSDDSTLKRAKITGPYGYIIKPFEQRELEITIEIALYKHQMETELKISKDKFQGLLENLRDVVLELDREGNFVFVSNRIRQFGFEPDEIIGKSFFEFVHPDDLEQGMETFEQALNGQQLFNYEFRTKHKDGHYIPVSGSGKLIEEGDDFRIVGLVSDITERRRAETLQAVSYKIADATIRSIGLEKLFGLVHEELGRIIDTKNFYISLYDAEKEEFAFPYYVEENRPELNGVTTHFRKPGKGLTEYVWRRGRGVLLTAEEITELAEKGEIEHIGQLALSWLGVPLKIGEKIIGIIAVQSFTASTTYTEQDMELLEFSSGQIAMSIEREKTEKELKQYHDHLEEVVEERSKEVAESEEKYRNLVERANDMIAIIQDGKIIFANTQVEKLLGYDLNDIIGTDFVKYLSPEQYEFIVPMYKARMEGKEVPSMYETVLLNNDGEPVHVEINASIIQYQGKPANMALVRDLTERNKAEEALVASEEKYRKLMETANDAIFLADAGTGILIEINKKAEELIGLTRKEIIGMHQTELHPHEERKRYTKIFKDHIKDGGAISEDVYVLHHGDGRLVPVMISASSFEVGGERIVQGIFHDITERKKAEDAIIESEEKFRDLAEQSPNMIFINQRGKIVYINPECERVTGYTKEEFYGPEFNFMSIIAPKSIEIVRETYEKHSQGIEVPAYEYTIIDRDGREIEAINSTKIIRYVGEPAILGIVTDITERKKAEEAPLLTQFAIDRVSDAAFWVDKNGKFFYVNDAACESLGYTRSELLTMGANDISNKLSDEEWEKLWERIRHHNSITYESLHIRRDGTRFPVEININFLRYKHREIICVFARDITEKTKAEEEKKEFQMQLNALFQASIDGIIVEKNENIAYANPTILELFGYDDAKDLSGKKFIKIIAPEDREMITNYGKARMTGKEAPAVYEFKGLRKDGTMFDAEISVSTYNVKEEHFDVGFIKDITERKRTLEQEVRNRILEAQFDMKSVITDIVPAFLDSLGSVDRAQLIDNLSDKLDKIISEKYADITAKNTSEEIAMAYIHVLSDLGGDARSDSPDKKRSLVTVTGCPWDNQIGQNLILCILCRGIAWRFAQSSEENISVKLERTMADGSPECEIIVENRV